MSGQLTKNLLIRDEVQVLHGFDSAEHIKAYDMTADMKERIVKSALSRRGKLWSAAPMAYWL